MKQEYIQVGCIAPTLPPYRVSVQRVSLSRGVSITETTLDRDSPGQHPPSPLGRDFPRQKPLPQTEIPLDRDPPLGQRPPTPVNGITDRCKNITSPQLQLQVVNIVFIYELYVLIIISMFVDK